MPLCLWGTSLKTWRRDFIVLSTVSLVTCRVCSRCLREQFKLCHWPWPDLSWVLRFLQSKASSPFCSLPSWCLKCTSERFMCKFFSSLEPLHCTICDVNKAAPALLLRTRAAHLSGDALSFEVFIPGLWETQLFVEKKKLCYFLGPEG